MANNKQNILLDLQNISTIKEMNDILISSPIFKELVLQLGLDFTKEAKELFTLDNSYQDEFISTYNKLGTKGIEYNFSLAPKIYDALNNTYIGVVDALDTLLRVTITALRGESLERLLRNSTNMTEVIEVLYSAMGTWTLPSVSLTKQINHLSAITRDIFNFIPVNVSRVVFSHDPQDYLVFAALTTVFTILLFGHNVGLVDYVSKY